MHEDDRKWFVGVDWATEAHLVYVSDDHGNELGQNSFRHSGEGLAEMVDCILSLTNSRPEQVYVAIEVPHGPVVDSLMERGFHVHAINPKQLDRFRDRFSPAGAKDDSRDGQVLGDSLRTDPHCFHPLAPLDPLVIELREWSRMAEELTAERTALCNRVHQQLWRYYPQMLELTKDLDATWFLELWALLPTPDKAQRVREETVARLLKQRHIRRFNATELLAILRKPALTVAAGTVKAATDHIRLLVKRLQLVNRQYAEAERQLDRLTERLAGMEAGEPGQKTGQRDIPILRSMPGLGRIGLAALLTEAPELLQNRNYHALRCLCGTAPVTKRSGKSKIVLRRLAVNPRLANAAYHWARVAIQHDPRSRAKYATLRQRGHGHARALRSVADRLLGVACTMLKTQTLYDPQRSQKTTKNPT
jgi:transposase